MTVEESQAEVQPVVFKWETLVSLFSFCAALVLISVTITYASVMWVEYGFFCSDSFAVHHRVLYPLSALPHLVYFAVSSFRVSRHKLRNIAVEAHGLKWKDFFRTRSCAISALVGVLTFALPVSLLIASACNKPPICEIQDSSAELFILLETQLLGAFSFTGSIIMWATTF
jgi:hypothetical protein